MSKPDLKLRCFPEFIDREIAIPELEKRIVGEDPTYPHPFVGHGYGYEYSVSMAERLLEDPLGIRTRFLSEKGLSYFYDDIRATRVFLGDFGSNHARLEYWYPQGAEPTCGAMSVATAALALSTSLEPPAFAGLLNKSIGLKGTRGLSTAEVHKTLATKSGNIKSETVAGSEATLDQYADDIKNAIDEGRVIMDLVIQSKYTSKPGFGLHWILLAGYENFRNRGLDVQVVDSNYGMMFLPAEFLHFARFGSGLKLSLNQSG